MKFGELLKPQRTLDTYLIRMKANYGAELVEKALARIEAGTVTETRFGWRVECRPEFGDNRSASGSGAYWPGQNKQCLCWYSKSNDGICSHSLAVDIQLMKQELRT